MRRAGIVGVGFWAPETIRTNDAWPAEFTRSFHEQRAARRAADFTDLEGSVRDRPYDELFAKHAAKWEKDPFKGSTVRRVGDHEEPIAKADALAAARALEDARIPASKVDFVLSSAIVPDKLLPSNAPAIQSYLGATNAVSLAVEAYCAAPIAQMELAAAMVESGRADVVVCVTSHHVNRINDLALPFSPMFGDASGAFVIGEVPEGRGLLAVNRTTTPELRDAVTYASVERAAAVWWRDGLDRVVPGSDDLISAKLVSKNLLAYPIDMFKELFDRARLPADLVAAVATIQPFRWFPAALAEGLGLPEDRIPSTFETYAHIGGAALAANLLEARRKGLLNDGAIVALYALGAGITRYAALLRWYGH